MLAPFSQVDNLKDFLPKKTDWTQTGYGPLLVQFQGYDCFRIVIKKVAMTTLNVYKQLI